MRLHAGDIFGEKYVEVIEEIIGRTIEQYTIDSSMPEASEPKRSSSKRRRGDKSTSKRQDKEARADKDPCAHKEDNASEEPDVIGMGEHVPAFLLGR